jgi:hypothetical protein
MRVRSHIAASLTKGISTGMVTTLTVMEVSTKEAGATECAPALGRSSGPTARSTPEHGQITNAMAVANTNGQTGGVLKVTT